MHKKFKVDQNERDKATELIRHFDNKMTVNMLGFTILTRMMNMPHDDGGAIQITAGMSWPLKENSLKYFGGYLIRFGFHLAMLTY